MNCSSSSVVESRQNVGAAAAAGYGVVDPDAFDSHVSRFRSVALYMTRPSLHRTASFERAIASINNSLPRHEAALLIAHAEAALCRRCADEEMPPLPDDYLADDIAGISAGDSYFDEELCSMTAIQREALAARHAHYANVIFNRRRQAIDALVCAFATTAEQQRQYLVGPFASYHCHTILMGTQVLLMTNWLNAFRNKKAQAAAENQHQPPPPPQVDGDANNTAVV